MHPPLGSGDGSITIVVMADKAAAASRAQPAYKGKVAVSSWEPLGPGTAGAVVTQTRTFKGFAQLDKLITGTP